MNYLGGWAITLLENMKNLNKEEEQDRFREATKFLEKRYGFDNIVYAYVHWDENDTALTRWGDPVFLR